MKRFRQGYERPLWRRTPVALKPDFLVRGVRTPRVVWGLAATALVMLSFATTDLLALREQVSAETLRLARWERQIKVAPRTAPATAASQQNPAQPAAWRIAEALSHPWGLILGSTEAAVADDVQWLALEHDSERPDLRLEGVSPDPRAALKAVDALARQPGWSTVVLTRLAPRRGGSSLSIAPVDGGIAREPSRFEITARIDGRLQNARAGKP